MNGTAMYDKVMKDGKQTMALKKEFGGAMDMKAPMDMKSPMDMEPSPKKFNEKLKTAVKEGKIKNEKFANAIKNASGSPKEMNITTDVQFDWNVSFYEILNENDLLELLLTQIKI